MREEDNKNTFDLKATMVTFRGVYEPWSKEKFMTISCSDVKCSSHKRNIMKTDAAFCDVTL